MEEFDLLKIERFIFQVYDHFLSYWRTLGLLVTSPSTVIASLKAIDRNENCEQETRADGVEKEPKNENEQESRGDLEEEIENEKDKGEKPATIGNSKQEKWSGLLTRDLASQKKRKIKRQESEAVPQFRFEEKEDGRTQICLPVLFALFNVIIVTILGLAMFPFIIDTFGYQQVRSVDAEIIASAIMILVIAFSTAQFVDAFFVKRGHPSRTRECLALCCYATGYLVPYYLINLIGVVIGYDVYVEVAWMGLGVFLALCLVALWGLVFWKRGLQHIYGASTLSLIGVTISSLLGALFIGTMVILFIDPTIVSNGRNTSRFNKYIELYRYEDAIKLGKCLIELDLDTSEKAAIKEKLLVALCRVNADKEDRLSKVALELEKTLGGDKETIDLGYYIEEALEHVQYHPDECSGPKFGFYYKTGLRSNRKKTMSLYYQIPTNDLLRQPMKSIPKDIDHKIAVLEEKLRKNVNVLIYKTENELSSTRRNELIHQLGNIMQNYHLEKGTNAQKQFAQVEAIYWDIQKQRLQLLKWMKQFPDWILDKDYDAKMVLK